MRGVPAVHVPVIAEWRIEAWKALTTGVTADIPLTWLDNYIVGRGASEFCAGDWGLFK